MKRNNITVTGIYHPPPKNTITNRMFIDDVIDHLITLLSTATNNIILGDFNMHINDINSNDACTSMLHRFWRDGFIPFKAAKQK